MEAFFLLSSITYNTLLSFTLTLLLPFQYLYHLLFPIPTTPNLFLYQGSVWYERRHPVHHSFRYDDRYALIDLDGGPGSLPSCYFQVHFSADQAREFTTTTGPVFFLTMPPNVGYEQNPLSVYYCYDQEGSATHLKKCIAEVSWHSSTAPASLLQL